MKLSTTKICVLSLLLLTIFGENRKDSFLKAFEGETSQKIHLMTVFNYWGMDQEKKDAVRNNVTEVQKFFCDRTSQKDIEIIPLEGDHLTSEMILQKLDQIKIQRNDTLIFYYVGQEGQYDSEQGNQFFGLSQEDDGTMTRAELRYACEQKHPRLTVLITDCPNETDNNSPISLINQSSSQIYRLAPTAPRWASQAANEETSSSLVIESLFLIPKGTMDLTTAQIGQRAKGDSSIGMYATRAWLNVLQLLDDELKKSPSTEISWRNTVKRVNNEIDKILTQKNIDAKQKLHVYEYPEKKRLGARVAMINNEIQIKEIFEQTPAAQMNLSKNDVICSVNGSLVKSESDFAQKIDSSPSTVVLEVQKQNQSERKRIEITLEGTPSSLTTEEEELANLLGIEIQGNAVISVRPQYPAEQAGLKPGDQIDRAGETPIYTPYELFQAIKQANGSIVLVVKQDNIHQPITLTWKVSETISEETAEKKPNSPYDDCSPQERIESSINPFGPPLGVKVHGNRVVNVFPETPAEIYEIQCGDQILSLNNIPIESQDQLDQVIKEAPREAPITVLRNGEKTSFTILLNKNE